MVSYLPTMSGGSMYIVRNLLKECGLEEYFDTFSDNFIDDETLQMLDDYGVQQIMPIIGHQMRFKKVLKDWQSQQKKIAEIDDLLDTVDEVKSDNTASTAKEAIIELPPESLIYSLHPIKDKLQSQEIENKQSSDGRAILAHGKSTAGLLDESNRKRLSQLIICNLLEDNPTRVISSIEFKELAANIQKVFPKENEVIFYSPYEGTRKGFKKNASGKLYETYINRRRKLRSRGELPGTSRCSSSSSRSTASASTVSKPDESDSEDETGKDKLNWLRNAVEPWHMVEQYWKATAEKRLKPIKLGEGNIAEYMKEFPALKQPKGYTLLLQDFQHLYPDKDNDFYFNFLLKREKIVELALDKKKTIKDKDIKQSMQNYIALAKDGDSDALTNAALILLTYVIGTTPSRKRGKQHWKPSRSEIRDGFITQAASSADVASVIETRRGQMQLLGKTLQPFVVYVGESLNQVLSAFVVINDIYYEFPTLISAVDAAFKIFQATGACYPDECMDLWLVIQIGFYKIKTEFDKPHQATNILLNDLELI